jgi:hypothetical protein
LLYEASHGLWQMVVDANLHSCGHEADVCCVELGGLWCDELCLEVNGLCVLSHFFNEHSGQFA